MGEHLIVGFVLLLAEVVVWLGLSALLRQPLLLAFPSLQVLPLVCTGQRSGHFSVRPIEKGRRRMVRFSTRRREQRCARVYMQPAAAAPPHPSRPPHCQRPPMAARQSTLHAENHLPPKTRASTRPRLRRPAAAGWTRRAGSARLSAEPGRVALYSRLLPAPLSPLHSSLRCAAVVAADAADGRPKQSKAQVKIGTQGDQRCTPRLQW